MYVKRAVSPTQRAGVERFVKRLAVSRINGMLLTQKEVMVSSGFSHCSGMSLGGI